MTTINLTNQEIANIGRIEYAPLKAAIDQAIKTGTTTNLENLVSHNCGSYIFEQLRWFKIALTNFQKARSAKKQDETHSAVTKRGFILSEAVSQMQNRVEVELRQRELFFVEDNIQEPFAISNRMSILVNFRWRCTNADDWQFGSIRFEHLMKVPIGSKFRVHAGKKLPAKLRREYEQELYSTWKHLRNSALWSVRDFFIAGGNGCDIPDRFMAVSDAHSGLLNNHCAQFWQRSQ